MLQPKESLDSLRHPPHSHAVGAGKHAGTSYSQAQRKASEERMDMASARVEARSSLGQLRRCHRFAIVSGASPDVAKAHLDVPCDALQHVFCIFIYSRRTAPDASLDVRNGTPADTLSVDAIFPSRSAPLDSQARGDRPQVSLFCFHRASTCDADAFRRACSQCARHNVFARHWLTQNNAECAHTASLFRVRTDYGHRQHFHIALARSRKPMPLMGGLRPAVRSL